MGIQGLLPQLASIHKHKHISEFAGQTLAVDAYVWLHKGSYGCAAQLAQNQPTTKYVDYAMHRVRLLRHHKITPYLVFDGGPLPAKAGTESDRKKRREENLAQAKALAEKGKHSQAREYFTKCVDITPEMAYQLIKALKAENISYVVAPYEADPQLAYLEREGIVDGIITEDSDLLVFGCRNVIFKLDSDGRCVNIRREDFGAVKEMSLYGWGDREFREMAMLSGCDYLPSIPGLGLKTAHTLLRKHRTVEKVLQMIRIAGKLKIPKDYLASFRRAEKAFLYQRVYDPRSQELVTLAELPEVLEGDWDEGYIGNDLEPEIAKQLAEGLLNPEDLSPIRDVNPSLTLRKTRSLPLTAKDGNQSASHQKNSTIKLTNFFKAAPSIKDRLVATPTLRRASTTVGNASGKRTLSEQMERDLAARQEVIDVDAEEVKENVASASTRVSASTSRFFTSAPGTSHKRSDLHTPINLVDPQTPRKKRRRITEPVNNDRALSTGIVEVTDLVNDPVRQEEGYLSPASPAFNMSSPVSVATPTAKRTLDVSSPCSVASSSKQRRHTPTDLGFSDVSSPAAKTPVHRSRKVASLSRARRTHRKELVSSGKDKGKGKELPKEDSIVLVEDTPTKPRTVLPSAKNDANAWSVDLRDVFSLDPDIEPGAETDRDSIEDDDPLPETPEDDLVGLKPKVVSGSQVAREQRNEETERSVRANLNVNENLFDEVDTLEEDVERRHMAVAKGWKEKFAFHSTPLKSGRMAAGSTFKSKSVIISKSARQRNRQAPRRQSSPSLPSSSRRQTPRQLHSKSMILGSRSDIAPTEGSLANSVHIVHDDERSRLPLSIIPGKDSDNDTGLGEAKRPRDGLSKLQAFRFGPN